MNSQDCIARGCAIQAAQLKPDFKTSNYILEGNQLGGFSPDVYVPVNVSYKYSTDREPTTVALITPGKQPSLSVSVDSKNSRILTLTIEDGVFPLSVKISFDS
jgi:hypothetical protein